MIIDSRIKKILTPIDFEDAEKFIGKSGYFGNDVTDFSNLNILSKDSSFIRVLKNIDLEHIDDKIYHADNDKFYCYFAPLDYVKLSQIDKDIDRLNKIREKKFFSLKTLKESNALDHINLIKQTEEEYEFIKRILSYTLKVKK